ncbi:MAG: glycosyltransferase family 4 protein [Bacteroidia bacterium]
MKVVVDMQKLNNLYSGLGQFCFHLGKELIKQNDNNEFLFLGKKIDHFSNIEFFEPTFLNRLRGKINHEVGFWHCTHQEPKFVPADIPYILTIHDLNFLYKYKSEWRIKIKLERVQKLINNASAIVTVSNFTLQEVVNNFFIPDIPKQVIYNGVTLDIHGANSKPTWITEGPFLFSIGIITSKKNFHVLLPFIQRLNYSLIIAGDNSSVYARDLKLQANKSGIGNKIIFPGRISEQERLWLYINCEAFVFPSLSEGFGLPVVEAMSLGKPVFLSEQTSLPEIGGDAAFYWNNFDPDYMVSQFQNKMILFNSDNNYANKLIDQSKKFSWKDAARLYLELYSFLADKKDKKH